jgi:deoxyadenosine/deoxycytidine kinase
MEQHRAGDENMPYTIAINAVSGGGKTALAKSLQESLPGSKMFCFDDFDETNKYAEDYYDVADRLRAEMLYYVEKGRHVYLDTERHKSNSDLILDGRQSLEELSVQILAHIRTRSLLKPS